MNLKDFNYESDDVIMQADALRAQSLASEDLLEALDELEETLESELTRNGEYENGANSEQACAAAEEAVRTVFSAPDGYYFYRGHWFGRDDEVEGDEGVLEEAPRGGRGKPTRIVAYWDTQDSSNKGWAWHAYWGREHEESGGFDGRSDLSDATITSRARAAAGYPHTRIPVEIK